jgi:hypothetical protein
MPETSSAWRPYHVLARQEFADPLQLTVSIDGPTEPASVQHVVVKIEGGTARKASNERREAIEGDNDSADEIFPGSRLVTPRRDVRTLNV